MTSLVYKDPTFNRVLGLQIKEKNCSVCKHGIVVFENSYNCKNGLRFPACRANRNRGFKLVEK